MHLQNKRTTKHKPKNKNNHPHNTNQTHQHQTTTQVHEGEGETEGETSEATLICRTPARSQCHQPKGAQLAGNQMYKVFIMLIDPNHSLNLARELSCFGNLPFWIPLPPATLLQGLHNTLTSPLFSSLARLGIQRDAVLRSSL